MISPYARRLRMAAELRSLRAKTGLTHTQVSDRSGESLTQISRLENAHLVDQASVLHILDALNVGGDDWTRIMTITREAAEKGWWDSHRDMGARQLLYANLESGATAIREYHRTHLPELFQTPEYTQARWAVGKELKLIESTADRFLTGMAMRQGLWSRPNAPVYEAVVDESVIRRPSAPPHIFRKQLQHLAQVVGDDGQFSLRVLPADAPVLGYAAPECSFSLYAYFDDPGVVAVEAVPTDLALNDLDELARYEHLYTGVRGAAYSPAKSVDLIAEVVSRITES